MHGLEWHRKNRGLSQRDLAEKSGVSPATIYELETGRRPAPRPSTLRKLADALYVDVSALLEHPNDKEAGENMGAFTAVYQREGDWWIGYVEELPGANAQGGTLGETRESLREAVDLILEANRELTRREFEGEDVVREPLLYA
jgi:transcriptional regulator with XRE-family HTH domain